MVSCPSHLELLYARPRSYSSLADLSQTSESMHRISLPVRETLPALTGQAQDFHFPLEVWQFYVHFLKRLVTAQIPIKPVYPELRLINLDERS